MNQGEVKTPTKMRNEIENENGNKNKNENENPNEIEKRKQIDENISDCSRPSTEMKLGSELSQINEI